MKNFRNIWETLTIKNKIRVFTVSVFVAIFAALLFVVWIVKLFVMDFSNIMQDNSRAGEIVTTMSAEIDAFDDYVRGAGTVTDEDWLRSTEATRKAIYAVPLDYAHLGDNRFARLQSLRSAYEVYCAGRNQVITDYLADNSNIDKLYDVYNMQSYLRDYAQKFVDSTTGRSCL